MDEYFSSYSTSEDDFSKPDYPLQDIEEAFKSLLEIEYNKDGTPKKVYADGVSFCIKIKTGDRTFSYDSESQEDSEYLIYLLLAFMDRKRKRDEEGKKNEE